MNRMLTTVTAVAASCFVAATLPSTGHARPAARTAQDRSDAVIGWNRFLVNLQATPGAQPPTVHPTYELAVMHAAIDDAVVATARPGSAEAAADTAAHDTLVALYPNLRATIDQQYATSLAAVRGGRVARRACAPGSRPRNSCFAGAPMTARRRRRWRSRPAGYPGTIG